MRPARAVVSCGAPIRDTSIEIVDEAGRPLPERGEAVRGNTAGKRWSGTCVHADEIRLIVEIDTEVFVTVSPADLEIE